MATQPMDALIPASNKDMLYTHPFFEKLDIYELQFHLSHLFDDDEDHTATYYIAASGSIEQVMVASRLLIEDKMPGSAFEYTLTSITKVDTVPFFGPNSIRRYQNEQVQYVAKKLADIEPGLKAFPDKAKALVKNVLTEQHKFVSNA